LKLFQEWGRVKEIGGWVEFKYYIFTFCKKFCKCHNVPIPSTTTKTKNGKLKINKITRGN
jgi:hypothetical protein